MTDFSESAEKAGGQALAKDIYQEILGRYKSLDISKKKLLEYCDGLSAKLADVQIMGMSAPKNFHDLHVSLRIFDPRAHAERNLEDEFHESSNNSEEMILELLGVEKNQSEFEGYDLENEDGWSFDSLYSALLEKEARPKDLSQEEKESATIYRGQEALSLIENTGRAVVLAGPGAGKTTFLKFGALSYLNAIPVNQSLKPYLPIFAAFRDIDRFPVPDGSPEWMLKFLTAVGCDVSPTRFTEGWLGKRLENGECIVYLDGIDEIPPESLKNCLRSTQAFSDKYRGNSIVASCRKASYKTGLVGFTTFELAPFSRRDLARFAGKWFQGKPRTLKRFLRHLAENENALQMCTTPLLSTMICVAYDWSRSISENRAELYSTCVDALLFSWDTYRAIDRAGVDPSFTSHKKRMLLSQVARAFYDKASYNFGIKELTGLMAAELNRQGFNETVSTRALLNELEANSGLIVEKEPGWYSFSHLSFQEYFCSLNYHEKHDESELFQNYKRDDRYREILLLYLEQSLQPASMIINIINLHRRNMEAGEETDYSLLVEIGKMRLPMNPNLREVLMSEITDAFVYLNDVKRDGSLANDYQLDNEQVEEVDPFKLVFDNPDIDFDDDEEDSLE